MRSILWHPSFGFPHKVTTSHQLLSRRQRGRIIMHTPPAPPVAAPPGSPTSRSPSKTPPPPLPAPYS